MTQSYSEINYFCVNSIWWKTVCLLLLLVCDLLSSRFISYQHIFNWFLIATTYKINGMWFFLTTPAYSQLCDLCGIISQPNVTTTDTCDVWLVWHYVTAKCHKLLLAILKNEIVNPIYHYDDYIFNTEKWHYKI